MAQSGPAAFLLYLALAVSVCYGANISIPTCEIFNSTNWSNNSNSAFNLTVSSETLSSNTTYTVKLSGSGNFTVNLQAESMSNVVGIWSQGNITCNQSLLFVNAFLDGSEIQTNWTSEGNLTTVKINAYIYNDPANDTTKFLISRELTTAITPTANYTTHAPVNTTTAAAVTNTTGAHHTTVQTEKTTSAGYSQKSSLISTALIQILCLVMISKRF